MQGFFLIYASRFADMFPLFRMYQFKLKISCSLFCRLTDDTNKDVILAEGRILLLKSTQEELQNHIEETAAEIRKKNYDKYKFLGNSFKLFI